MPQVRVTSAAAVPSVDATALGTGPSQHISDFAVAMLGGPPVGERQVSAKHPQAEAYSEF